MIKPSQPTQTLVVYGAGGHGRAVAEAAELAGMAVVGFVDDAITSGTVGDWPVLSANDRQASAASWIVAIGDNATRRQVFDKLITQGRTLANVEHPTAFVSPSAELGRGVFVGPSAVIHTNAVIGQGSIINTAAIVEHDAVLGEAVHLGPGAVLGGGVTVGDEAMIGLGSRVLPGLAVGQGARVGAGAVVTHDVAKGATVRGVPAK